MQNHKPQYHNMKKKIVYLSLFSGLCIAGAACVSTPKTEPIVEGRWKVADIKTTDSSADMGLLLMVLAGTFPDSIRFEQDSLRFVMNQKDTLMTEAMKYTRKRDSLWVHNVGGAIEPLGIKWKGDSLLLAGNGYTYYLVH